ncbi:bifunctional metallophosphatase/5'-nucleotidase [Methylocystis suflitae]|uniref:bifunctional metallophosphatase/5'-nucleotidase n=1 Tax=Methylocystis suflitae TaxID=2951405 RepID=UPI002109A90F|nr:bifunctional UDP-sugar hydrolase/5'-nucleotidase [Methylocystis suflitae]MCQ4191194.1 bifunctional metallophosphatase/5'-nucleotidase [Methylocystis suflitae]
MFRKLQRSSAILFLLAAFAFPAHAAERVVNLTFVVFSDIYEMAERDGRGGFARIAGALKAERARAKNIIVAHAGDTLSPSLTSSVDKGAHIIDLLNRIGLDVFTPGNHEFDFGEAVFRQRMGETKFALLAANLRDASGRSAPGFADSKIVDVDGVKVGIFGLTDDEAARRSSPGSLKLLPAIETAKRQAKALRDAGADLVVVVTHSEWQDDLRLAKLGPIDIVLSGHDHNLLVAYDGRAAVGETQADGVNLVAIDVEMRIADDGVKRWTPRFRIIDTSDVTPDAAIAERVAQYEAEIDKALDVDIGRTKTPLDSRKASVRSEETAIGDFFADAMRAAAGADVAIINGGGIRGNRSYAPGTTLTRKDIAKELPFNNQLVTLELSGADLRAALENAVWLIGKDAGRFAQISGARIVVRRDATPGSRLVSIEVGGKPLDDTKLYKVATIDFLARGKDGYAALARGKPLVSDLEGPLLTNVIIGAIEKAGAIAPVVDGRIRIE